MYDPKTNKFPYPEDTGSVHYLAVKKDNGNVYDQNFTYIDTSKSFKFKRFWFRIFEFLVAFPVLRIRMGLKVKGKENLKKYKDVLKKGVVSISNHVHMWDYMSIMCALWPRRTNILAWSKNMSGENAPLIKMAGGIAVPDDPRGTLTMTKATTELIKKGGWLHIMAEGTMWEYYAPIRPFKEGAAYFAYRANKPVLPMAFSYRPVKGIRKHLFHQIAKYTLTIGEPIYPDMSLSPQESVKKLTIECHEAVCKLAGWKPGENIYPPIYNKDTCKRIDYYTNEYGVGYKGSW